MLFRPLGRGTAAGIRPARKAQAGTTLVEFSLVALVLMTLLLGVVDFGRALYAYHFCSDEAREATRWAAVNGYTCADDTSTTDTGGSCNGTNGMNNGPASDTDITNYVLGHVSQGLDPNRVTVTVSHPVQSDGPAICTTSVSGFGGPYNNYPGCTVEVEVSYNFNFISPLVHSGTIPLSSTSEMVIAH
jgi:Flp pilus assembly protein TadG